MIRDYKLQTDWSYSFCFANSVNNQTWNRLGEKKTNLLVVFFSFKPSVVKFWCSWVKLIDNVLTKRDNRIKSCVCTSLEWKWKVAKDISCNVIIIQFHPVRQGRAVNEGPDGTFSEQASFMGHLIQKVLWKVKNCNIYIFCPSQQINPLSAASLHVLHFFRGKPRNGRFCGSSISTTFSLNANREISGKAKSGVMSVKISRVAELC